MFSVTSSSTRALLLQTLTNNNRLFLFPKSRSTLSFPPKSTALPRRRMASSSSSSSPVRASASSAPQKLADAEELIDSVETFIFDCDGVIWKGDSLIEGVPETLDMLRSKEEIFASSFAAAAYLTSIDFPKDKKVHVIGEEGILKELGLAGFQYLGGPEDGDKKIQLKPGFLMEHDESVQNTLCT